MIRRQLVVMLKEPRPGRVKTRLARDIGPVAATWWVRHQTTRLLRRLRDPRWDLVLAVAPDVAGLSSRAWPDDRERMPQGPGNLGDRMARVMRTRPPGPVCIIGGDIPGITPAHIARAFASLGRNDAVFGPAPDGGYWLIGMKRTRAVPATFLQDVRWSTEHALADSRATLPDSRIGLVDTLRDVDTADDLRAP
ncbi:2-phospho-L-lactate guanylyltransferase [Roseovarius sp. THAF27]|nr:2-phospho-L-lactate guanylyltransferase [Roseovarius sp. THAF27]